MKKNNNNDSCGETSKHESTWKPFPLAITLGISIITLSNVVDHTFYEYKYRNAGKNLDVQTIQKLVTQLNQDRTIYTLAKFSDNSNNLEYKCENIAVPTDWSQTLVTEQPIPKIPTTKLLACWIGNANNTEDYPLVIFNPGGPGRDGVPLLKGYWDRLNNYAAEKSGKFFLATWQPRGVKPEFKKTNVLDKKSVSTSRKNEHILPDHDAINKLNKELQKTNTSNSSSSTYNNVLDMVAVNSLFSNQIGNNPSDKINYYGGSYGTEIGYYLLNFLPESANTVVLDSLVGASKDDEKQAKDSILKKVNQSDPTGVSLEQFIENFWLFQTLGYHRQDVDKSIWRELGNSSEMPNCDDKDNCVPYSTQLLLNNRLKWFRKYKHHEFSSDEVERVYPRLEKAYSDKEVNEVGASTISNDDRLRKYRPDLFNGASKCGSRCSLAKIVRPKSMEHFRGSLILLQNKYDLVTLDYDVDTTVKSLFQNQKNAPKFQLAKFNCYNHGVLKNSDACKSGWSSQEDAKLTSLLHELFVTPGKGSM